MSYYVDNLCETYASLKQAKDAIKKDIKATFPRERWYEFGEFRQMDAKTLCMNVRMPTRTWAYWVTIV